MHAYNMHDRACMHMLYACMHNQESLNFVKRVEEGVLENTDLRLLDIFSEA